MRIPISNLLALALTGSSLVATPVRAFWIDPNQITVRSEPLDRDQDGYFEGLAVHWEIVLPRVSPGTYRCTAYLEGRPMGVMASGMSESEFESTGPRPDFRQIHTLDSAQVMSGTTYFQGEPLREHLSDVAFDVGIEIGPNQWVNARVPIQLPSARFFGARPVYGEFVRLRLDSLGAAVDVEIGIDSHGKRRARIQVNGVVDSVWAEQVVEQEIPDGLSTVRVRMPFRSSAGRVPRPSYFATDLRLWVKGPWFDSAIGGGWAYPVIDLSDFQCGVR